MPSEALALNQTLISMLSDAPKQPVSSMIRWSRDQLLAADQAGELVELDPDLVWQFRLVVLVLDNAARLAEEREGGAL